MPMAPPGLTVPKPDRIHYPLQRLHVRMVLLALLQAVTVILLATLALPIGMAQPGLTNAQVSATPKPDHIR